MLEIISVSIAWWILCGAAAYSIFTWWNGCYFDDDKVIRAIIALFGPLGLVALSLAGVCITYLFVVRKIARVLTGQSPFEPKSKPEASGSGTPNIILM